MKFLILYIVRLAFLALTLFELANLFGILHFELDFSWLGLIFTSLFVWIFLEIVNYYHRQRVGRVLPGFILITTVLMVLVDALGDVLRFYSRFWWYDQLTHALGGIVAAGVLFFIVWLYLTWKKTELGNKFIGLVAVSGTACFAALYEIEEYLETLILHNNRLGDRFDTPNDILWTVVGGIVGVLITVFYRKGKKLFRSH